MQKRTAGLIISGILVTGVGGGVAMTPASATASDNAVTSRLAGIKNALSGLVSDGTLTQSQANKVASTLDSTLPEHRMSGRPGGHFGWMGMAKVKDAAAKALGMTTAQLHTALHSGKSLADVAKEKKVSVDSLIKAMVTATEDRIAAAVKDGTITKEQADRMKSSLTERITDQVNRIHGDRGPGSNHRGGRGPGHGFRLSPSMGDDADSPASSLSNAV